jgi:hypothetical protein
MRRKVAGHLFLLVPGRGDVVIMRRPSERVEPRHQFHLALPTWRLGGSGRPVHFFQSFAFGFNIGARIDNRYWSC